MQADKDNGVMSVEDELKKMNELLTSIDSKFQTLLSDGLDEQIDRAATKIAEAILELGQRG